MLRLFATVTLRCVGIACYGLRSLLNSRPPQFCNRSYGNITYVGAHDSYAVGVNNRKFREKNGFISIS